jgi:hypothetical protein
MCRPSHRDDPEILPRLTRLSAERSEAVPKDGRRLTRLSAERSEAVPKDGRAENVGRCAGAGAVRGTAPFFCPPRTLDSRLNTPPDLLTRRDYRPVRAL